MYIYFWFQVIASFRFFLILSRSTGLHQIVWCSGLSYHCIESLSPAALHSSGCKSKSHTKCKQNKQPNCRTSAATALRKLLIFVALLLCMSVVMWHAGREEVTYILHQTKTLTPLPECVAIIRKPWEINCMSTASVIHWILKRRLLFIAALSDNLCRHGCDFIIAALICIWWEAGAGCCLLDY